MQMHTVMTLIKFSSAVFIFMDQLGFLHIKGTLRPKKWISQNYTRAVYVYTSHLR